MSGCGNIQHQFEALTKLSPDQKITLEQINKWLTDAKLMEKKITPQDIKLCFDKFKSETIDLTNFIKFLNDLSQSKGIAVGELEEKLASCELFPNDKAVMQVDNKITDAMKRLVDDAGKSTNMACKRTK